VQIIVVAWCAAARRLPLCAHKELTAFPVCSGLMAKQSLEELGLAGLHQPHDVEASRNTSRSEKGFTAGVRASSGVK
jgi:hypothetical protein